MAEQSEPGSPRGFGGQRDTGPSSWGGRGLPDPQPGCQLGSLPVSLPTFCSRARLRLPLVPQKGSRSPMAGGRGCLAVHPALESGRLYPARVHILGLSPGKPGGLPGREDRPWLPSLLRTSRSCKCCVSLTGAGWSCVPRRCASNPQNGPARGAVAAEGRPGAVAA